MKNKQIYCITGKSGISNLCSFTKKKGLTSGGKSGILVKQMTFTGRRRLGMSKDLRFAMLLDCYGEFLTPHQYRLTELYYCADLSLSEIAEIVGITRQGAGRHQAWRTDFAGNGRQAAVCGEVQRSAGKLQCDRLDVTVDPDTDGRPAAGADRLPRGNGSGTSRAGAALKKLAGEEITWHLRDFPEN